MSIDDHPLELGFDGAAGNSPIIFEISGDSVPRSMGCCRGMELGGRAPMSIQPWLGVEHLAAFKKN